MSLVDLGKRLLEAAKRGETEEVRTLMSNGAPFTTDWLGTSPLHFSAQYGHYNTAEVLLRAGISRDARTKVDRTPLHVASQEGHLDIVGLLLQHSADIDARDMLKMTPLHWATEKGHVNVIDILLKAGADVTCENKFDRTALDIAVINGRPDIVQSIQLANNIVPGLSEPTETVTVETSELPNEETVIDESGTITIEGGAVSPGGGDASELTIQNIQNIKAGEKDDSSDGSSTSVLATLAALAEATAPNNTTNTSTADAMNWLESQGITMISTSDGNIITSAVESGQTITLTEAGKIALNIISQQNLEGEVTEEVDTDEVKEQPVNNVITIVTKGSGDTETDIMTIPVSETISTGGEGDIVIQRVGDEEDSEEEPPLKRIKTEADSELYIDNLLENKDSTTIDPEDSADQETLRKELEEFKRQAEKYKEELLKKDKDLEEYKKQLSQISEKTSTDETESEDKS